MLGVRLVHRLVSSIRSRYTTESDASLSNAATNVDREMLLDDRPVSSLIGRPAPEDEQPRSAEDDEGTILDIGAIPEAIRAGRNCTLCLEERTNSCSTECGHLFCWDCIVGWGREKVKRHSILTPTLLTDIPTGRMPSMPTVTRSYTFTSHL
jgi:peroxin-10